MTQRNKPEMFVSIATRPEAKMLNDTRSTILVLRIVGIFALVIACGLLIAIVMGKSGLLSPIALMLLVAGLALNVVASAKAKNVPPQD